MKQTNQQISQTIDQQFKEIEINKEHTPNLWDLQEKQNKFKQSFKRVSLLNNCDYIEYKTVDNKPKQIKKIYFNNSNKAMRINPFIKITSRKGGF